MTTTVQIGDPWATVPDVARLSAAAAVVADRMTSLAATPAGPKIAPDDLVEQILTDGAVPADLGRDLWDRTHDAERTGLEREALLAARETIGQRLRDVRVANAATALRHLHDVLVDDILPQVRALVRTLGRVSDANAAIAAGVGDTWRALVELDHAHRAIRAAQHRIVAEVVADQHIAAQLIDRAGRFSNVVDFEPYASRIADGPDNVRPPDVATAGAVTVHRHQPGDSVPSYSADGVLYTTWLARDDVDAWVPSVRELQAAADGIDQAIRDADRARTTARTGGEDKPFAGVGNMVAVTRR